MAEWKKIITSGSNAELNQVTSSGISVTNLDATNIGAFTATGAIDFNDENLTNVDIDSGDIASGVTINKSPAVNFNSGDVQGSITLTNLAGGTGALTIQANAVEGSMLNSNTVDDATIEINGSNKIAIKDGGVDSDALAADISVTTLTATTGSIGRVESVQISGSGLLLTSASIDSIGAFNLGGKLTAGGVEIEGSNFDINGGTIDGATIATSDITVGTGKTLNVSAGTLTLANDQISGDAIDGGTIGSITISQLAGALDANNVAITNVDINSGTIDGTDVTVGSSKTLDVSAGTLTTSATQKAAIVEGVGTNVDIGDNDLRAQNLLADSLTSGRVVFAGTNGVLSDDGDLTFSGDTLTSGTGSFQTIEANDISGSFRGDGSNLTGVGTDIDTLSNYGAQSIHQTDDHFLISDDGTEKKITFSDLEDSIFANVSGDATIAGGGALTIGNDKIGNDELKQNVDVTLQALTTTNNLSVGGSATITGDLTVNGTTTTVTSTNVAISDKFMFLASGSTATDGGIIVAHDAANSGSAFGYDVSEERWAFQSGSGAEGMNALEPDAYAVAAVTDDNTAAYRKNGNIRVEGGEIFIYVE